MPHALASLHFARAVLAANRPIGAGDTAPRLAEMERHAVLAACFDPRHAFRSASGRVALRAVDDLGQFCWLIRGASGGDALVYHPNPYAAAAKVRDGSGHDRPPKAAVAALVGAVGRGDVRLAILPQDFRTCGPLLRAVGRLGMPGWLAARLLPVAPAMGTAIWTAHRRSLAARQVRLAEARLGSRRPSAA